MQLRRANTQTQEALTKAKEASRDLAKRLKAAKRQARERENDLITR